MVQVHCNNMLACLSIKDIKKMLHVKEAFKKHFPIGFGVRALCINTMKNGIILIKSNLSLVNSFAVCRLFFISFCINY